MVNRQLNQSKVGTLRNSNKTYDSRQNKISNAALKLSSSPLIYLPCSVNKLGSTFNPDAHVTLKFGINSLTTAPGVLIPPVEKPKLVNLKPNGNYYLTNNIVKTDKYGPYLKFGKNKIYF